MISEEQTQDATIILRGVHKWYDQFHVLKNIDLTVQNGERIGKSVV